MDYTVVTAADRPDLINAAQRLPEAVWPAFMVQDPTVERLWMQLYERYPEYQFMLLEPGSDRILAMGNSAPSDWDEEPSALPHEGVDWIMETTCDGPMPSAHRSQFALQVVVDSSLQGKRLSGEGVRVMMSLGRAHGCRNLYLPVRPNQKHLYPLTPMERYIHWTVDNGLPFDAWMRVHARLGGEIIGVCEKSMQMPGRVADWEAWAGMRFPESGRYVIPKALVPVEIDCENDRGLYVEPNVWMLHRLT